MTTLILLSELNTWIELDLTLGITWIYILILSLLKTTMNGYKIKMVNRFKKEQNIE